jgi:predicted alpha/beta hydrolase family esterase
VNAIVVHGCPDREEFYDPAVPSASNHLWLPWLANQLIVRGIPAHTPEMPLAFAPDFPVWSREFERYDITAETLLVGHSCGAGFLLRWLSEHAEVHVGRVVLVAPWLDVERAHCPEFFDFTLAPDLVSRTAGLTLFNSDDDGQDIQRSVSLIRERVAGVAYREFHGRGHFTAWAGGGTDFPEVLDELVSAVG